MNIIVDYKDTIQTVAAVLFAAGVLIGGAGYLLSILRKSNRQENQDVTNTASELTSFWKDQVDGFKIMVAAQDVRIQNLTNDLNQLKGQIDGKDKQIKDLTDTLNLRNPEMESFIKFMTVNANEQLAYRKQTMITFDKMVQVLDDLHAMSTSNHNILKDEQGKELHIEGVVSKK